MAIPGIRNVEAAPVRGAYEVRETTDVAPAAWDAWLEGSPGGGHVLQSHAWGEFKRALGWRPARLALERDGRVVGLGQFLVYKTPLIPGSLMYCAKGPWLPWEDEEAVRAFFGGVRAFARRSGVHTVKIEPEVREGRAATRALLSEIGFRKFRWDLNFKTTMLVDLGRSGENLLAGMKGKTRYNVRLASRKGVRVVEDGSPEAFWRFWRMFEGTSERNGFAIRRPFGYQSAAWRAMRKAGRAHLFFAEHEGEPLAAMIVYVQGRKLWYMLGASSNERRNLMPTHLLQWEVMRWAKRRGVDLYDMVAVPPPDELDNEDHPLHGVYKFKAGFGGEVTDFLGCMDMRVGPLRAGLWNRFEPAYYRLHQKLRGDIYY